MIKNITKVLLFVLMSMGVFLAQATDVTFTVNLHYLHAQGKFTPNDLVSVVVNNKIVQPLRSAHNDLLYSGVVTGLTEDTSINYVFRIIHDGDTLTDFIHQYVVQPNANANTVCNWFNDQLPDYPYAKFFTSTVKAIPGELVRFFEVSEGATATTLTWMFEGGNPATAVVKNPIVVYNKTGRYAVNLIMSNEKGSSQATTMFIDVTSTEQRLGWWNDQVFYQIYPWAFLDTDGNGTGDIRGIINKLDYLNDGDKKTNTDLGVTALYIMPVHPATNVGYGGYEITDYKAILQQLGTQADFDELITKAHARGMKVILDEVFNHTSAEHPWFKQARSGKGSMYEPYYVFSDTKNPSPWGWRSNTISTKPAVKYWWSQFNGEHTADLNFRSLWTRNAIKDVSSYWLNKNIDGFRIDAPIYFFGAEDGGANADRAETYAYCREWSAHIKSVKPDVFSVGETWFEGCYTGRTEQLVSTAAKYTYQGFDVGFQFNITYGIQDALNNENKIHITEPMDAVMKYYPFLQFGVLHSNHDTYDMCAKNYEQRRLIDRLLNNYDAKAKIAATLVLTLPGVPFLYYGDEVGTSGGKGYSARKPMPWNTNDNAGFTTGKPFNAISINYETHNVATETTDANSFLSLHKKLIRVRLQENALRRGDYKPLQTSSDGVYAFARTYNNEVVFVIINLSSHDQYGVLLSLPNKIVPANTYTLTDLMTSSTVANRLTVTEDGIKNWIPFKTIPANAFYILKFPLPKEHAKKTLKANRVGKKVKAREADNTTGRVIQRQLKYNLVNW